MDAVTVDGLVRSDPSRSGIRRRRCGRGFRYLVEAAAVTDTETLARVKALVIPPAWEDVWICPDPAGHIQAVGTDAAGRRQYRYHDLWRERRDHDKHDRVLEFGPRCRGYAKRSSVIWPDRGSAGTRCSRRRSA
ncbi:MAG: hypothetical protein ACRDP6_47985 [Actinoallomurus sp.]